jgi:dTDP-4-dehydrorhamnose 3,5-epimerase
MPERREKLSRSIPKIQFTESKLSGCFIVQFPVFHDNRGHFVKTIQSSVFEKQGLEGNFSECFYTTSFKDVLRGMHFQTPPSDHAKLVYCTAGSIYDVALDLRVGSPTYGKHEFTNFRPQPAMRCICLGALLMVFAYARRSL